MNDYEKNILIYPCRRVLIIAKYLLNKGVILGEGVKPSASCEKKIELNWRQNMNNGLSLVIVGWISKCLCNGKQCMSAHFANTFD